MTRAMSYIRELPNKTSNIVESIGERVCCRVIEEAPYWVKVTWEENGIEKTGWIAKRNIYHMDNELGGENEEENIDRMKLFTKTDTTLVYIVSDEFAKEIMKENYHKNTLLYIHITRDTGLVMCYENNDINKVIHTEEKEQAYILEYAETDR